MNATRVHRGYHELNIYRGRSNQLSSICHVFDDFHVVEGNVSRFRVRSIYGEIGREMERQRSTGLNETRGGGGRKSEKKAAGWKMTDYSRGCNPVDLREETKKVENHRRRSIR